jgi:hypothetical protein
MLNRQNRPRPVPAHSESNHKIDINVKRHNLVTGERKHRLRRQSDIRTRL